VSLFRCWANDGENDFMNGFYLLPVIPNESNAEGEHAGSPQQLGADLCSEAFLFVTRNT